MFLYRTKLKKQQLFLNYINEKQILLIHNSKPTELLLWNQCSLGSTIELTAVVLILFSGTIG